VDSSGHQGSDQSRHQGESYRRIEVITGPVRRRRWTTDEKVRILMESLAPGARIADVARRHNLNRGLLQAWRRQAVPTTPPDRPTAAFVPICCSDDIASAPAALPTPKEPAAPPGVIEPGVIEIELGRARVRVRGAVDVDTLRLVLGHLGRRA
jgi:transposase